MQINQEQVSIPARKGDKNYAYTLHLRGVRIVSRSRKRADISESVHFVKLRRVRFAEDSGASRGTDVLIRAGSEQCGHTPIADRRGYRRLTS